MFSFFKRKKEYKNLAAAPTMPPAPSKSAAHQLELREEIRRPVVSTSNYDSGPDIVDTIIAAEIISSAFDSSNSYDSGSSHSSGSSDFSGGGGSSDGGGASGSWDSGSSSYDNGSSSSDW